jgi:Spy/CpxP family protein refolding chaperone
MKRIPKIALLFAAALAACAGDAPGGPGGDAPGGEQTPNEQPGGASGGQDNTFDHPNIQQDVWALLDRLQEEGPPEYTARVHSCPKIRYRTIGQVLASLGVDLAGGDGTAGAIYGSAGQTLGEPNYGARMRENLDLTTASASKLFDIFAQAAPEIIANMPALEQCKVGGAGAQLFNQYDQCLADGVSCLLGVPATASHMEICNQTVANASDPERGKVMAVALLAAAAHTCE